MPSRTTMRRRVIDAGMHYSDIAKQWRRGDEYFGSLEDTYEHIHKEWLHAHSPEKARDEYASELPVQSE